MIITLMGFYYHSIRYLDPKISRWMSPDPAWEELINPKSDNYSVIGGTAWYVYCDNNPLKYVDPNGLNPYSTTAEYTLIIYNEDPTANNNEIAEYNSSSDSMYPGHTWIGVKDKHGNIKYYGWGPNTGEDPEHTLSVKGQLYTHRDQAKNRVTSSYSKKITEAQANAIDKWWRVK